jgi:hypothetical protein
MDADYCDVGNNADCIDAFLWEHPNSPMFRRSHGRHPGEKHVRRRVCIGIPLCGLRHLAALDNGDPNVASTSLFRL